MNHHMGVCANITTAQTMTIDTITRYGQQPRQQLPVTNMLACMNSYGQPMPAGPAAAAATASPPGAGRHRLRVVVYECCHTGDGQLPLRLLS